MYVRARMCNFDHAHKIMRVCVAQRWCKFTPTIAQLLPKRCYLYLLSDPCSGDIKLSTAPKYTQRVTIVHDVRLNETHRKLFFRSFLE